MLATKIGVGAVSLIAFHCLSCRDKLVCRLRHLQLGVLMHHFFLEIFGFGLKMLYLCMLYEKDFN